MNQVRRMNVTGCVPLAGRGLVARRGGLVALTDGMDAGPDPLLAALAAVADANGDGAVLVLAGTRAAVERGGRPAWACAGVTFGGEVAVLVHGEAAALVSVDGRPEAEVTASGSMIPVVRTFTGAVVSIRLVIGATAAPDPRLWLAAGTVFGGGVLLTVTQEKSHTLLPNEPYAPVAPTTRLPAEQAAENAARRPSGPVPVGSVSAVPPPASATPDAVMPAPVLSEPVLSEPVQSEPVQSEPVLSEPVLSEPVLSEPVLSEPVLPQTRRPNAGRPNAGLPNTGLPNTGLPNTGLPNTGPSNDLAHPPGYEPTMLAWTPPRSAGEPAGPPAGGPAAFREPAFAEMTPFPDDPFANPAGRAAPGQAGPDSESWFRTEARPSGPTLRMTQPDGAGAGGGPEPPIADLSAMKLVQLGVAEPFIVDGAMCARMHFNAPNATFCRECGISMREAAGHMRRQPRPSLGVLLVDDGRGYPLDRDYVIGREPLLDGDVAAGRATPLPMSDPESSVSRLHLRVCLVGWQVEVRDLGSSNGSVLYRAAGPRRLSPADAVVLDPGARVGVGQRTVQFLAYGPSHLGAIPDGATS
jgi:hypothetical protein